jgi:hypothetical protein
MAAVAMVTKVQKMLNSLQTSQIFAVMFPVPIPIFLAYLVPLDVDVVPIKFHQFLFGEYPAMIIFVFFNFFYISIFIF